MRRIAIIAGLILAGFAALAAVALFNLRSIATNNKDVLLARAEESLGRKVSLGELTVRVSDGAGIRAKNLAVADDPAFSTGEFVKIAELRSRVSGSVRERYARIFTARDTVFDELQGSFISTLGAAQFKNVLLLAPDFGARGEGRGNLKGRIDFAGALPLSSQISRSHYFGNGAQVRP
jgi:hypothetical protein